MFSRASLKRVVKIRHADRKRQFDDLSFVVKLAQFFEFGGADCGRGARHAAGVANRRFFILVKQQAALVKRQGCNLFESDPGALGGGGMRPRAVFR